MKVVLVDYADLPASRHPVVFTYETYGEDVGRHDGGHAIAPSDVIRYDSLTHPRNFICGVFSECGAALAAFPES